MNLQFYNEYITQDVIEQRYWTLSQIKSMLEITNAMLQKAYTIIKKPVQYKTLNDEVVYSKDFIIDIIYYRLNTLHSKLTVAQVDDYLKLYNYFTNNQYEIGSFSEKQTFAQVEKYSYIFNLDDEQKHIQILKSMNTQDKGQEILKKLGYIKE